MPSPPKPWERAGVTNNTPAAPPSITSSVTAVEPPVPVTGTTSSTPAIPERPVSLSQPSASTSLAAQAGTSAYSNNLYSSPYNRFGAGSTYSPFGTGYGSYGSYGSTYGGYGGYGGSMYGGGYGGMGYGGGYMPGMGMGLPGQPLDPSQSLTAQLSNTTQHTFQLLHSIVQTFGGFAQMLESTFMATHSSFFAMVGVIDQFATLRDVLGQVLGVFGLIRWAKGVLSGEGVVPKSAMTDEFNHFVNRPPGAPVLPPGVKPPKPSKKPVIVFLLAIFGIPYLMHRIIRRLAERPVVLPPGADPSNPQALTLAPNGEQMLDPSKLSFAHALYPFSTNQTHELNLKKGDIIAILSRSDPVTGLESEWWRGRTRDGREGWFPKAFVEIIQKKDSMVNGSVDIEKMAKKID